MTLAEFYGCNLIAFGPPFALFLFTVASDPIRVIVLAAASFYWLVAIVASSLIWFTIVPLRDFLAFGVIASVLLQEVFRYLIYRSLRRVETYLETVTVSRLSENKHVLSYVIGLGFGIISGLFALVNLLADSAGPGTMGLNGQSDSFFITSAAQALAMILLNTLWSVIFFNALDTSNYFHITYVVGTHLFVSLLTLLNSQAVYSATLLPSYAVLVVTMLLAFKVAGGSTNALKRFIKCQ